MNTKFYKSSNDAANPPPDNRKTEIEANVHLKGKAVKKQENKKTEINHDAENSHQQAPHEARPSWRR